MGSNGLIINYPVLSIVIYFQGKNSKFKKYVGHSAHVTNVRWTHDDKKLVSTGGADTSMMVWQRDVPEGRDNCRGESDDSDTDSEEEGMEMRVGEGVCQEGETKWTLLESVSFVIVVFLFLI